MTEAAPPRSRVRWARTIADRLDDRVRIALAADLAAGIQGHLGLTIRSADGFEERGHRGWCDGVSLLEDQVILYRPTAHRRGNFTLAHEAAHHLVETDDDCLSWLADLADPMGELEQLCDEIAGRILVTDEILDATLAGRPPSADTLTKLFTATQASRSACVVAAARRLPCEGFAVLIEIGSDYIFHAARTNDTLPYAWRGDRIPAGHPLGSSTPPERTRTYWPHPNTSTQDRRSYFMSCADLDGWRFAVFADNNLWEVPGLHLTDKVSDDRGYDGTIDCPCGYTGPTRWWPCKDCGISQCPKCQDCDCHRRKRLLKLGRCKNCTVSVAGHLLEGGLCDSCR